jgi:hypothetical protein
MGFGVSVLGFLILVAASVGVFVSIVRIGTILVDEDVDLLDFLMLGYYGASRFSPRGYLELVLCIVILFVSGFLLAVVLIQL